MLDDSLMYGLLCEENIFSEMWTTKFQLQSPSEDEQFSWKRKIIMCTSKACEWPILCDVVNSKCKCALTVALTI